LSFAIDQALKDAGISANDVGFISAHGTATPYNDEMEANAISLSGLGNVPLNSLKANYGHTLGAAGLIESIASLQSLKRSLVLPTMGFEERGVSRPVNVCATPLQVKAKNFLKTASGFGGCNAAVVFGK
ncbi:MAG: beta-ketoacyl synthase, partial [Bacteroidetes bacterium]|nr:beta-ketoacyl synthase [Bacteroidota bacterium]